MFNDSSPQDPFADKSEDTVAIMSDGCYANVKLSNDNFSGFTIHAPNGEKIGEYNVGKIESDDTIGYWDIDNRTSKPGAMDLTAWYLTKITQKKWFEIDSIAEVKIYEKYLHPNYEAEGLPNGLRCPASIVHDISKRNLESYHWTLRQQVRDITLSQESGGRLSSDSDIIAKNIKAFEALYKKVVAELGMAPHIGEYTRLSSIVAKGIERLSLGDSYEVTKRAIKELRPVAEAFPDLFNQVWEDLRARMPGKYASEQKFTGKTYVDIKKEQEGIASPDDSLKEVVQERHIRIENYQKIKSHKRLNALASAEIEQLMMRSPPEFYPDYATNFNILLFRHYQSRVLDIAKGQKPQSAEAELALIKKRLESFRDEKLKPEFDKRFDDARHDLGLPQKGEKSKE